MVVIKVALVAVAALGTEIVHARALSGLQNQVGHALDARATYSKNVAGCPGYKLSSVHETSAGLTAKLTLAGTPCTAFGQDIKDLTLAVTYESNARLHVNIHDTTQTQFTVPYDVISPPGTTKGSTKAKSDLIFNYESSPFAFWITRRNEPNAIPLFDTRIKSLPKTPVSAVMSDNSTALDGFPLVFEDSYLQITSALPQDANVYGLGEAVASSGIRRDIGATGKGTIQTNWARDVADPVDENEYGIHPFYLEHRYSNTSKTSSSHGVFLNSAAGADILLLSPEGSNTSIIEYRMLGGTFDFYFFSGPSSQKVVEQYSEVSGKPTWNPLWAFGFHLCRWGYKNVAETKSVVEKMKAANIPLEVMWNDIDIYHAYRDFTLDPVSFAPDHMRKFIEDLHKNGQHYIPIVDAAIPKTIPNGTDSYDPYTSGSERKVFITNSDGTEYVGQVWPGYTVFTDFFAPNAQAWWTESLQNWTKLGMQFDGLWLDMNEASSFCEGSCGTGASLKTLSNTSTPFILPGEPGNFVTDYPECYNATIHGPSGNITVNGTLTCDASTLPSLGLDKRGIGAGAHKDIPIGNPPYSIHDKNPDLSNHTLAVDAVHHGGYLEFDVHNLYGTMEEIASNRAIQKIRPGQRPFMIARSTFAGAGKYTGHWLGDNFSKWAYLHYMVQGVLQFQLFQIPMVGADTCGFNGNSDEELCNRWMQTAAFTPFFRNHNIKGAISQEPYVWDSVAEASRVAIKERYRMLPYWYSLFANASMNGSPTVRPLFFEFPNEPELFGVDEQFLIGHDILVTPVLTPNTTTVSGFFPAHDRIIWRDWYSHMAVKAIDSEGKATLDAPLGHINVHIRDGSALLLFKEPKYTVTETSKGPYELLVNLAKDGYAHGAAYIDDGESYPPGPATQLEFDGSQGQIAISVHGGFKVENKLTKVTLLGVSTKPKQATIGGNSVKFSYDADVQRVVLDSVSVNLNQATTIKWT